MSQAPPFTKADVDAIVAASKFTKAVPTVVREGGFWKLQARVYRTDQPGTPINGVTVCARVKADPLAGLPRPIPSATLNFHGWRVRGIDRNTHDNPDGTRVKGWHEHVWAELDRDTYAISIPEPKHGDLQGIFRIGLERWNIAVLTTQDEV